MIATRRGATAKSLTSFSMQETHGLSFEKVFDYEVRSCHYKSLCHSNGFRQWSNRANAT